MSAATDAYIDRARGRFVEDWRECCRIPSVSGSGAPIERMASWIEGRLAGVFDVVRRIPIPGHGPLLAAVLEGTGPERLLVYTHYDVQPAGDAALWSSPPFDAAVRDGRVYARGACDDKADVCARLHALEAWLDQLNGRPPFTVVWLCDPAEEVGSPGLREALAGNAGLLRADACLWESFLRDDDGRPGIGFGCRGLLDVELRLRLLRADQHPAFAPILRSAPIELARVVASLVDARGDVQIKGFHASVREPTPAELRAAAGVPLPTGAVALSDRTPYVDARDDSALAVRLVFSPAMTVSGVPAGEVTAAAVPAQAHVNLRFELVPDQDPADVHAQLREHLDAHGFGEVETTLVRAISPARAALDTPFAAATIDAAREIYGEPVVYPVLIGVGPGRVVLDELGAPLVSPAGTLRPGGGMHAPDEHGAIDDYVDHVRFTARLFELAGERGLR